MTLTDARRLRDEIRAAGVRCVTPLGHGPDGYFARISNGGRSRDFSSRAAWLAHVQECRRRHTQQLEEFCEKHGLRSQRRSPIEMMVDRACGLE